MTGSGHQQGASGAQQPSPETAGMSAGADMSEKEGYSSGQAPGLKTSAGAQVGSAFALQAVGGASRPACAAEPGTLGHI